MIGVPRTVLLVGCVLLALSSSGCKTVGPYDYTNYRAHPPRSILVLPPLNESTAVRATYGYLSTVSAPLAEQGYYVFPVAVVDQLLRDNGLPTPGEMHQVPLHKVVEITGADAVLFVTVQRYGTQYQVVNAATTVEVKARLVDTRTETLLWEGHAVAKQDSGTFEDPVANLIAAAISQIVASKTDVAHELSREANANLFTAKDAGLLYGPYSPRYQQGP
jgi:hypothetical protein